MNELQKQQEEETNIIDVVDRTIETIDALDEEAKNYFNDLLLSYNIPQSQPEGYTQDEQIENEEYEE